MSGDALDANLERLRRAVTRRRPAPVMAPTFASAPAPTAPPILEPLIETPAPALAATPPTSLVVTPQPAAPPILEPLIEAPAPALAATRPTSLVVTLQPARPATPTATPPITHAPSAGPDAAVKPRLSGWFARLLHRLRPRRASPDA
jgi:hypothetical protein